MSGWLLNTNVISELLRPRPNARVRRSIESQRLDDLYISAVKLAEIRFGIETLGDAVRRAELQTWLAHSVRLLFDKRVLAVSENVMFTWRLLVEEGRKAGHTFYQPELIIAATARHHGLTVVTRDKADYARARVPLLNPWLQGEA